MTDKQTSHNTLARELDQATLQRKMHLYFTQYQCCKEHPNTQQYGEVLERIFTALSKHNVINNK